MHDCIEIVNRNIRCIDFLGYLELRGLVVYEELTLFFVFSYNLLLSKRLLIPPITQLDAANIGVIFGLGLQLICAVHS